MELKYPESRTSIDDMCAIIKFFDIEKTEYTDCTILYEVTFDQLRAIYNLGKDQTQPSETEGMAQRPLLSAGLGHAHGLPLRRKGISACGQAHQRTFGNWPSRLEWN